ncbi:hypothetical protein Nepgr_014773 [Nepenthes gracilis]|uniref:Uncharacterized protein n=1 Tax=Nepenthes gracilis TaxID=150966 RepID=A0AAD3SLW2_NEPGR|nr:hypothetical protein Nepgr_014773 [Nepenthes gracilis]
MRPDPPIANAMLVGWRNSCMDFDRFIFDDMKSGLLWSFFLMELFENLFVGAICTRISYLLQISWLPHLLLIFLKRAARGLILCSLLELEYRCPRNGGLTCLWWSEVQE